MFTKQILKYHEAFGLNKHHEWITHLQLQCLYLTLTTVQCTDTLSLLYMPLHCCSARLNSSSPHEGAAEISEYVSVRGSPTLTENEDLKEIVNQLGVHSHMHQTRRQHTIKHAKQQTTLGFYQQGDNTLFKHSKKHEIISARLHVCHTLKQLAHW